MTPSQAVAVPDPNIAVDTVPGEGNFDATVMMERFNEFTKAKEPEAKVEEPVKEEVKTDEPTKTEEVAKVDDGEIPEDFPTKKHATPEAIKTWKSMKDELSTLRSELSELKEKQLPIKDKELQERLIEIEEAKKKLAEFEGKDLSQYEKRIKELEERDAENEKFRSIHDVVNSRAFQEEVIRPSEQIGAAVEELAQSYDISPDVLKEAMKLEDPIELRKKLRELTFEWNPVDAAELAKHAKDLRDIVSKSQSMLDNAENAKKELKFIEETEAKKKAEAEEIAIRAANEAVEKQINEKFAFLKEHPDVLEAMKSSKFEDTPANRALAAKLAPLVTKLNDLYTAEKQRVMQLQEEMNKRNAAKPNVSTNVNQPVKEAAPEPGGLDWESSWSRFQNAQRAS